MSKSYYIFTEDCNHDNLISIATAIFNAIGKPGDLDHVTLAHDSSADGLTVMVCFKDVFHLVHQLQA